MIYTCDFLKAGELLRYEREYRRVSLRYLSELCDVSPSAMSSIETGKCRPSVALAIKIVKALKLSVTVRAKLQRIWEAPDKEAYLAWNKI
jgi:transcriptional regulator with XRE-family HTH domain